ncbi:hypothetical protein Tco_0983274, partial [Tanacetum coccineum]
DVNCVKMQWIIHKGWLEWSAKAAKDEIEVKTGNSKVNAAGHYLLLLSENETVHEERGDSMERAATTTASLDAEQDSGNIIRTQSMATLNEPIPQGTSSGSGPRRQDTILGDRPAQTRFERLSKQSNDPPLSGVNTPGSGEDRLKIMELMEICTKLSDRGRYDHELDVTTVSAPITTAGVSISTVELSTPPTTTTVIEDEDFIIA